MPYMIMRLFWNLYIVIAVLLLINGIVTMIVKPKSKVTITNTIFISVFWLFLLGHSSTRKQLINYTRRVI